MVLWRWMLMDGLMSNPRPGRTEGSKRNLSGMLSPASLLAILRDSCRRSSSKNSTRGSKGGGKGQAKETSRPRPPNRRDPPAPQRGGDGPGRRRQIDLNDESIVPCCNPLCGGFNGGPSFKPVHRIGKGPGGDHCQGCGMPWSEFWGVYFEGEPIPRACYR